MAEIKVNGIELLDEKEKEAATRLLNEYIPKIERLLKKEFVLEVYFKEHEKDGKRKKYSIDAKAVSSTNVIFSVSGFDWDFARTLHKVMNKLQTEIEHRFHSSDQHDKR